MRAKPPKRYEHTYKHNAYGIQNWLAKNNYKVKYRELITGFCFANDFEIKSAKTPQGKLKKQMEAFIQHRFPDFCKYVRETQKPIKEGAV